MFLLNLSALKEEHVENSRLRRCMDEDEFITLDSIVKPIIVKVSLLKGKKRMADEEPTSSPDTSSYY
ncbi:hypothetical protein RO3G_15813 [Rhizopus delemar RA 99-880]|uniref:Uncharacterized protein n=1 Tax=Rhizopus delemar (strain RA 99-880 / ATCC MYA-4621 / FGSC 9543 / NRRL 43880) TaxID=246409 RepID=I1CRM2_RHIO9|nr:hypothetical protein RO3G_15813 [Rhizopus delemar RA 99-880]|eukprot:EIE91102.1 hypothetical protein RO3G_15813 [Rhizopus delemar RA 99-880]